MCRMACRNGFKTDDNGCEICECKARNEPNGNAGNKPNEKCSNIRCRMACKNGFKKDDNGCEICECKAENHSAGGALYTYSDTGVCDAGYTSEISESECRDLSDGDINGRAVGTFVRSACEAQWTPAGTCFIFDDKVYYTNTDCGQNPQYQNHNLVCKREAASYIYSDTGVCGDGYTSEMSESECRDLSDGDINGRAVGTFWRSACEAQWTPAGTCFIYDDKLYYANADCGQNPSYHNHNLVCKYEETEVAVTQEEADEAARRRRERAQARLARGPPILEHEQENAVGSKLPLENFFNC